MKEIKISEPVVLADCESVDPARLVEVKKMVVDIRRKMFSEREKSRRRWISAEFYEPLR